MSALHDRQGYFAQAQAMRRQARLTCQRAVWARQKAAMACTRAQLTELRGLMPGATAMTCEITAVILTQRGLLNVP
jgi:hypothetical protein